MVDDRSFQPRAGIDYPRDLAEFHRFFRNEESCQRYLHQFRWKEGFVCPRCRRSSNPWQARRDVLLCPHCRFEARLTAGTVFEGTRKPLRLWFLAMWELTSQKYGANALGMQRVLGLGSYATAWAWLHKLRRAMVRPGRDRLQGCVEVDETYVGGEETGAKGRQTIKKAIVAIAVELKDDNGVGRIRLRHVPDIGARSLQSFVTDVVEHGSIVRTDGLRSYAGLELLKFRYTVIKVTDSHDPARVQMPSAHRVASLLKRWVLGTFQGSVSKEHLQYYLDEFTFRFNRRASKARGMLFYRLLEQAALVGHTGTRQLFKKTGRGLRPLSGGAK
jgi:transposase-like protein